MELDRKLNPFPRASAREAPAKPQAINFFSQRADNFPIFRIYGFYMALISGVDLEFSNYQLILFSLQFCHPR